MFFKVYECIFVDYPAFKVFKLSQRSTYKVPYASSLDPDETPSDLASHLYPSCLTFRNIFWHNSRHFADEGQGLIKLFQRFVDCGDPPMISGGQWTPIGNKSIGDVAYLACDDGYLHVSCSFIVCQADGNWTESTASCSPIGTVLQLIELTSCSPYGTSGLPVGCVS